MTLSAGVDYELEPCPVCRGSGFRLVPPPGEPRPGAHANRKGRRHGFESTYSYGCRCDLCKAAHRQYRAKRVREGKG